MTDVLTKAQRTRNMAAIRGKDTKPELIVRRLIHSLGFRFRLHKAELPGKPDLVFVRARKVIFVHGCFWHSHDCRKGQVFPKTNPDFWRAKREGTTQRDERVQKGLRKLGWNTLTIWECEIADTASLTRKITEFLTNPAP